MFNRGKRPFGEVGIVDSLSRSQAMIMFAPDGTILDANQNFLETLGYGIEDIKGKHHNLFVPENERGSDEYKDFWSALASGEHKIAEFRRIRKDGSPIWIQGSYNPVRNRSDKIIGVVKFATDITDEKRRRADIHGQLEALSKSQAVVEFELDGTIIAANEIFTALVGYRSEDVVGQKHSRFVDASEQNSDSYREFWQALARGEHQSGEFRRIGRGDREIWIQATYTPIFDMDGKPFKVVKFAVDVTADRFERADTAGQIAALNKSQAVIEFEMDSTIITANDNFLAAMGYDLDEIRGEKHALFADPVDRDSDEYKRFWAALNRGEHQTGEFRRIGKSGREVWIQASYNPIFDMDGKPFKVVKFATDITQEKLLRADMSGQLAALHKSQAVIEFNLDGTIITANSNFLGVVGYALDEITGQHHSMFVETTERESEAYRQFWAALNRGEYQSGEYKRVGKNGQEVWIQASYNPIVDMNGKPFKVVKFATEMTERKRRAEILQTMDDDLGKITEAIGNASAQASNAATTSGDTSERVQTVASGVDQLASSISEINEQVSRASEISEKAVSEADKTNAIVTGLAEAAQEIGAVVDLISDIAEKTNLLALNATIEAARAGEAGKGFAVVASEVKSLASQTAKATENIGTQIHKIQGSTDGAVTAIGTITETIGSISEISSTISAAVEEQSIVTTEMAENMKNAADNVGTISSSIAEIAEATTLISEASHKVKEASQTVI